MTQVLVYEGGALHDIHKDWLDVWAAQFADAELAQEMLRNSALSARIGAQILTANVQDTTLATIGDDPDSRALHALLSLPFDALLRGLGLLWAAPALAPRLHERETRQTYGLKSRQLMLLLQDHSTTLDDSDRTDMALPAADSLPQEGQKCVRAWLARFPNAISDRLTLMMPKFTPSDEPEPQSRDTLVDLVLRDRTIREALVS